MTKDLSPSELSMLGIDPALATKDDPPPFYTAEDVANMSFAELREAELRHPHLLNAMLVATGNAEEAASFEGRAKAARAAEEAERAANAPDDAATIRALDIQKFIAEAPDMDADRRAAEAKRLGWTS